MNIKSLLLGSAAAMVAVSGVQAADAIVVEPEPVEFVRVCDAYGSGFFFIPGTETCLRISGFVRTTFGKEDEEVTDSATGAVLFDGDSNFYVNRARVDLDARNETDWGTLRSVVRFEAGDSSDPSGTNFRADVALVSLAGFRIGQNGANYWSTNQGFAGVNLSAVGFGTDGYYSFDDSMVFDYTFAADGFAVTVGVENTNTGVGAGGFTGSLTDPNFANFYAGFNYSNEFGDIAFTAAHDAASLDNSGDQGGWAYSISATADLSSFLPGGTLHGFYQFDDDYNTTYVGNGSPFLDEESAWGVSFQMNLTDEVEFIALYNRAEGDFDAATGLSEGEADLFTVGLNWFPAAAPGFSVRGAYSHEQIDETLATGFGVLTDVETDFFEFTVRRDF